MTVDLEVRLTTAVTLSLRPAIPELTAALCRKVLAYHFRGERRDAFDVWRLLEVARADGLTASHRPATPTLTRVAELLRGEFVPADGRGVLAASTSTPTRVRLRVLATSLAGGSGRPRRGTGSSSKIAELDRYLQELHAELGPLSDEEREAARTWADRVLPKSAASGRTRSA